MNGVRLRLPGVPLRLPIIFSLAVLLSVLAACTGRNGVTLLPELTVTAVTPERMTREGGSITIQGKNFFEVLSGTGFSGRLSASACGMQLTGLQVNGIERTILAAPGHGVSIRLGDTLTGTLPAFETVGPGDVVVTLPDGRSVTAAAAVDCFDPAPRVTAFALSTGLVQAGLPATFTWSVTSPDAQELSCSLTAGDGSEPLIISDCQTGSAQHTYLLTGEVRAVLSVSDAAGREASSELSFIVGNAPPVASFTASATAGAAPLTVEFDATSSSDPNGTISSYEWDFGDGSTASGEIVEHTFVRGSHTVTLTVTDDDGAQGSSQLVIHVDNVPPTASFTASVTAGNSPLTVEFDASSSSDPNGTITSYEWDFGDGNTASGVIAEHTFVRGSHTVTLTVTDDDGAQDSSEAVITVRNAPPSAGNKHFAFLTTELPLVISTADLLANTSDPDGDELSITSVWANPHVTLDSGLGVITYDPGDAFDGLLFGDFATESFNYTVDDGFRGRATGLVDIDLHGTAWVLDVQIVEGDQNLPQGITFAFTADVDATGGASRNVTWTSSNEAVATIDADGLLTALTEGAATITATSVADPGISNSVTVTVDPALVLTLDTDVRSSNKTFELPLHGTGKVTVHWGDGTVEEITDPSGLMHEYTTPGIYTISVSGTLSGNPRFGNFGNGSSTYANARFVTAVTSWGDLGLTSLAGAFMYAENLTAVPADLPASVRDITLMFSRAHSFNQDISSWKTGNVTNMRFMFAYAYAFNQDIGGWDTSNVTDMSDMFQYALSFNQDIGRWDTSNVTDMSHMFSSAHAFNQDLGGWCVQRIPGQPRNFDFNAQSWTLSRPRWGTACQP